MMYLVFMSPPCKISGIAYCKLQTGKSKELKTEKIDVYCCKIDFPIKKERKNVDFPHISDYLSISVDYIAALFLVKLGQPCLSILLFFHSYI